MSKGKKRSGARPGRPQPLRGTKGKRRSEERFSRNAETDLVCRLLLEKKNRTTSGSSTPPRRRQTTTTRPCSTTSRKGARPTRPESRSEPRALGPQHRTTPHTSSPLHPRHSPSLPTHPCTHALRLAARPACTTPASLYCRATPLPPSPRFRFSPRPAFCFFF